MPEEQIRKINYYESATAAPEYQEISVCECYGFDGLFKMPTFENAIREAKAEAVKQGGDAIVFLQSVRAVDLPDRIDLTEISARLLLREKAANALVNYMDENMAQDQLVWFFSIVKLKR